MVLTRLFELLSGKFISVGIADDSAWNLKDIKVSC
jgi:hypothetical protein